MSYQTSKTAPLMNDRSDDMVEERPSKRKAKYANLTFCDDCITPLIRKCWSQEPKDRPNFFEIC